MKSSNYSNMRFSSSVFFEKWIIVTTKNIIPTLMEPIPTAKNHGALSANPTNPAPARINDSAVRISAKEVRSLANSVRLYAREDLNFSDS